MNNVGRSKLEEVLVLIDKANKIIDGVLDAEQVSLDNIPDNLYDSPLYRSIENGMDHLTDALEALSEAVYYVEKAMERD